MRRIRSKHTSPEMLVRRLVHRMGLRYRLPVAHLPGNPDLVFARLRKIIEVRGCFSHQHRGCIDSHIPQTRSSYWRPKLQGNVRRDRANERRLKSEGWKILTLWECDLKDQSALAKQLRTFLGHND